MAQSKLTPSLRPATSNPTLQDIPLANLTATYNWRGTWFLRIVATPTLTPTYPAAYGLQPQRGTNHDVSFEAKFRTTANQCLPHSLQRRRISLLRRAPPIAY